MMCDSSVDEQDHWVAPIGQSWSGESHSFLSPRAMSCRSSRHRRLPTRMSPTLVTTATCDEHPRGDGAPINRECILFRTCASRARAALGPLRLGRWWARGGSGCRYGSAVPDWPVMIVMIDGPVVGDSVASNELVVGVASTGSVTRALTHQPSPQ